MSQGLIVRKTRLIWTLRSVHLLEGEKDLRWDTFLKNGVGVKYERGCLISSAKQYICALIESRARRHSNICASSIKNDFYKLRTLSRWMIDQGMHRYSQLDASDMFDFIEYVRNRSISSLDTSLSRTTVRAYATLFSNLWELRNEYERALRFDPKSSQQWMIIRAIGRPTGRWRPLPDDLAIALIRDAVRWLDTVPVMLQPLVERLVRTGETNRGLTRRRRKERADHLYDEIASGPEFQRICNFLPHLRSVGETLRVAVDLTFGAALVVILFLTGMRIGEVLALRRDCVTERTHSDGKLYRYLRGKVEKRRGLSHEWIVPEPVVQAVEIVKALFERDKKLPSTQEVFLSYPVRKEPIPAWFARLNPIGYQRSHQLLRAFVSAKFRSSSLRGQDVHTHQARKTFARFVALRDKRALDALAQHYGHVQRSITDQYYVGTDLELVELLQEADYADLEQALTDLVSSAAIAGAGGARVRQKQDLAGSNGRFSGKRTMTAIVRRLIADGVRLAPCDWGYCLFVSDLSACGGGPAGPNAVRRSPDVCARCANFAVTEKHRAYWEQRWKEDRDFLSSPSLPLQTVRYLEDRVARAEKLLVDLNSQYAGQTGRKP